MRHRDSPCYRKQFFGISGGEWGSRAAQTVGLDSEVTVRDLVTICGRKTSIEG